MGIKELQQQIADQKAQNLIKFREKAWDLALLVIEDIEANPQSWFTEDVLDRWSTLTSQQKTSVMDAFHERLSMSSVRLELKWSIEDVVGKMDDVDEGDSE